MDNKETLVFIACRIRDLCTDKSISFQELAKLSGVALSTIYKILIVEQQDIGIVTLERVCSGLCISLREFWVNDLKSSAN